MTDVIRVFVNGSPVDLPPGANVADALGTADSTLAEKLATHAAYVTDGRGIEIDPAAPLSAGAILRVVVSARRGSTDADA